MDRPYWFGRGWPLLRGSGDAEDVGLLAGVALPKAAAIQLYDRLSRPRLDRMHIRGLFARLGLLEWTPLSPEGVAQGELRRLTQTLLSLRQLRIRVQGRQLVAAAGQHRICSLAVRTATSSTPQSYLELPSASSAASR